MVSPAGGGPTGGWPRISRSGLARPGPARSNPATRRCPTSPDPRPGSRVRPRLRRTWRHHMPRFHMHLKIKKQKLDDVGLISVSIFIPSLSRKCRACIKTGTCTKYVAVLLKPSERFLGAA
ncbi:hypothetical protein ILYODFUR_038696 [Ilyodon furcidens]|uniref:Uncharacterized protein n=1 Tax=Ilyodon furcidens TaxID=33524 RepID=A0ABV0VBF4_9TELE